jgi:hypothetical protein
MAAADTVPPNIGSHKRADLASALRLAWRQRNPGSSMITEDPRRMEPRILRDHGLILVG